MGGFRTRELRMLGSRPRFLADGVLKSIAVPDLVTNRGADCNGLYRTTGCCHFTAGLRWRSGQRRVRQRTRPRPPATADRLALDSLSRTPLASI